MIVLGINAFHGDSAACLMVDGEIRFAAEEERYRRRKHWAGFPTMAIDNCLRFENLSLDQVDVVAINTDPHAARWRKLGYSLSGRASMSLLLEKLRLRQQRKGIEVQLADQFPEQKFRGSVEYVEHHLAHLASAYSVSQFDDASIVSVDGFGDFASAAWGLGQGDQIDLQNRVYFPHSLGIFYQALTQYLGFENYGDEYKVMGLAPYGQPTYRAKMDQILRQKTDGTFALDLDFFLHHRQRVAYEWEGGSPKIGRLYADSLQELLGPARQSNQPLEQHHMDVARSIQDAYERAFFHLLESVHARHGSENLALAGGCGMNSVANGKVHLATPFKRLYVQSAAGDAGGAIGAAVVASKRHGVATRSPMSHAYLGNQFTESQCVEQLEHRADDLLAAGCEVKPGLNDDELFNLVADALIAGQVVGWFQGRMEWGPRALGNRSILGDPRRPDMKDILNLKIKRRESFRPFAPSILRDEVANWFESDAEVPFMMKVFQILESRREQIPAVTHVDGSGRLQTVHPESNPRYYGLIQRFHEKTGVPMLLNTSFNENEPVVCKPEEALDCFLRTNMDVLVLGSNLVMRKVTS